MNTKINNFDKQCLLKAINTATASFKKGNYPVGAVLSIDNKIIATCGNEMHKHKSFVYHAENGLIINNGDKLFKVRNKKIITIYTTLEPCIQCLGACVTNHVDRIVYIQKDPNGGACSLKHNNIGLWYKKFWPQIIYAPISETPKKLMLAYFKEEIKKGNNDWPKKMISLLS